MSLLRSRIFFALATLGGSFGCSAGSTSVTCETLVECSSGICVDGTCVEAEADSGLSDAMTSMDSMVVMPDATLPDASMDASVPDASAPDASAPDAEPMPTFSDDADGDGISDYHEGRYAPGGVRDSDGDGTPDYLDDDSDGDGLPDSAEAGDADVLSAPPDSDSDGLEDYRDPDSDDNGIVDGVEGVADTDGDGREDFRDFDNDNDGIRDAVEIGMDASMPRDTDMDGVADHRDTDSDGDTILDSFEQTVDTDGDLQPDIIDLDSDGDGLTDAMEAGDADPMTPPVDTDMDGTPDFRDPDSDGDGLSDAAEVAAGTDPTLADSDGDGVSDLIEVGAGTRPLDPTDSPRTRGDFVFLVPYMAPPSPARDTLQFATAIVKGDIYFLVDTTGSMGGELATLKSSLSSTIIPSVRTRISQSWFGVGGFDDYPTGGYGSAGSGDLPFYHFQNMSSSTTAAQSAVNRLSLHYGVDYPESHIPALYSLASRNRIAYGPTAPRCAAGYRGFPCFRPDAVPVIVIITDAISHNYPGASTYSGISPTPPSYTQTITALRSIGARVVGVNSGGTDVTNMLRDFARRTDTVDSSGSPNSFVIGISSSGSGLGSAVVDAIERAAAVPIEVSAQAVDRAVGGETVDAVSAFMDRVETRSGAAAGLSCTAGLSTYDRGGIDSDAFPDTFRSVRPGQPVCFDIVTKSNVSVMPTLVPQIFEAQINVIGDGFTPLDDRVVYFLVPPRIPDPNE